VKYVWEPSAAHPQKAHNPHSWSDRSTAVQEYGRQFSPSDYATSRTIRPYSLGQNPEWDAVSRMLAAGLVTVCPDPMAVGLVRVEMVDTAGDIRPQTARATHPATHVATRPTNGCPDANLKGFR
jgi:hypothetical protein